MANQTARGGYGADGAAGAYLTPEMMSAFSWATMDWSIVLIAGVDSDIPWTPSLIFNALLKGECKCVNQIVLIRIV